MCFEVIIFIFFLHFNIIRAFLIAFSYYWRLTNLTYTEKIVEIKEDCYILDVPCRFSIMFLHFSYSSLLSSVTSNLQFVTSWFFLSECLFSLEFSWVYSASKPLNNCDPMRLHRPGRSWRDVISISCVY